MVERQLKVEVKECVERNLGGAVMMERTFKYTSVIFLKVGTVERDE